MECSVYKGKRKADHYLFLPADALTSDIPDSILDMMGELEHVMKLDITPVTRLAQSDPVDILEMITEKGFFIQIPPKTEKNNDSEEF